MQGSVVLDKLNDPALRTEWNLYLQKLYKALKHLNEMKFTADQDPTRLAYMEAVLEFAEARDQERNFFWQSFVELRETVEKKK